MVFRGQNYLSSAIRRVSSDVAGLSNRQALQMRQAAAAAAKNRAKISAQAAQAELASVRQGGARYMAMQNAINSNATRIARTRLTITNNENDIRRRGLTLSQQQAKLEQANLNRFAAGRTLIQARRQLDKASTAEEIEKASKLRKAAEDQYKTFGQIQAHEKEMVELRQAEVAAAQQGGQVLKSQLRDQQASGQQLLARRDRLKETEQVLAQRASEANRQLALQNIRLAQAKAMLDTWRWQNIQNYARQIEHLGRVAQMFGLIASASFGYAAKSAADFNTQMTIAATQSTVAGQNTVANVQKNAKQIGDAIKDLMISGKTIANPQELGQGIYDIFSGVTIPGNQQQQLRQGITLMKEFNDVLTANAGMVTFDEVTQAGITILNDFQVPLRQMPRELNRMQAAVRFGRMTMSEFISTMNQAAPAAKQAGYTFDQMAGSMAAASRWFPSIRFAATGYARLIDILLRNADAFEKAGIQVTNSKGQLLDLAVIAENIIKKYPALKTGGAIFGTFLKDVTNTQGTMQARRFLTMLIQNLDQYKTVTGQVAGDNNELTKSLRAAEKSSGVTWAQFVNQLRAVILMIGEEAVPAFQKMGRPIVAMIKWFKDLDPRWKHMIGYMGSMVAMGTLLTGVLVGTLGGIVALGSGAIIFLKLRSAMKEAWAANKVLFASNVATAESTTALATAEAGFVRVSGAAMLGMLAGVIPLVIMYHRQIGQAINATGGWSQALILLAGAFAALNVGRVVSSFVALSTGMKLLLSAGGLWAVVAVMTNFAGSADLAHKALDGLFSGWAGYIATTVVLATAVSKLTTAFKELQIVTKATALWSGLTGVAASVAGIPAEIRAARNLRAGLTAGGIFGRTVEGRMGIPAIGPNGEQWLRSSTGQYIGKMAAPMGEAAIATTGLRAAVGGLGAALAGFLPMLVVGGGLMGGLYLWKRHLDAVHDAQEKVRRTQEYLTQIASSDNLIAQFRQYGSRLTAVQQARIDYNKAFKAYEDARQSGVRGDNLRQYAIDLANATRALRNAEAALQSSTGGIRQAFNKSDLAGNKFSQIERNVTRLKWLRDNIIPRLMGGLTPAQQRKFDRLQNVFDVTDLNDINKKITLFEANLVMLAGKMSGSDRQLKFAITKQVQALLDLRLIPQTAKQIIPQIVEWITKLKRMPSLKELLKFIASWNLAPLTTPGGGGGGKGGNNATQSFTNANYKMWTQVQEIAKLHQRAIQTGSLTDWRAYYTKLNKYQSQWKDVNLQLFNQMLDTQENAMNQTAENTKTTFSDVLSSIKSMYDNFKQQETSIFGALGQGPLMTGPAQQFRLQWGGKATGMDYLNDLKQQTQKFLQFHTQLAQLGKKGAPAAMMQEIAQMGEEEGGKMMKALAGLTPQQLNDYFQAYNKRQKIIEEYTKKDLTKQLEIYRKHGKNIALAIIAGLRSENVALEGWLKNLINKMFPGLPTGTGGSSTKPPPRPPVPTSTHKTEVHKTEIHVTAKGSEADAKNQVRQAIIAGRNRYTGRGPGPR